MTAQTNIFDGLVVDNFAGGGGASMGIELALGRPVDIAINHDRSAIAMHEANHPFTRHYCESVWDIDPIVATNGQPVTLAWFSPDCKHFSKARGGRPADKNIRGLAWVAVKWAQAVRPRVIMLENVEEFVTWGPLDGDGMPDKSRAGETFNQFVMALIELGYNVEWCELRASDYGAPTIRKRLFLVARCDGQPITWPTPTHGDPKLKRGLKPWRTAAEIIDWSLPCPSIFDTADEIKAKYGIRAVRPLAEATLCRIARGLKKFVIDNPKPFIVQAHSGYRENDFGAMDEPLKTVLTRPEMAVVAPTLIQYHGEQGEGEVRGQGINTPILTVDAANRYGAVAAFLSKFYGDGKDGNGSEASAPVGTVTQWDHNSLVAAHIAQFNYDDAGQSPDKPLHTVVGGAGHLGEVRAFLTKYYGVEESQSPDNPLHTITTRDRFGVVIVRGEPYAIVDIGLRMLTPRELFNAQGFPPDYIIDVGADGKPLSRAAQVARCGNSVCPALAEALVRANLPEQCGGRVETMKQLNMEMAV
jgi:DNA (cytosine-5)-methyltransferase 1